MTFVGDTITMSDQTPPLQHTASNDNPWLSWEGLAFALVVLASVLVHLARLDVMAMHHDESIHAWLTWRYYMGDGGFTCAGGRVADTYCYDPVYHGPSLYVFTLISYFLFGDGEWQSRLPQALAGIGLTLSVAWLRPYLGRWGTIIAMAAVTLTSVLLYFTRFARHDGLMVLWVLWVVIGFFRYIDSQNPRWLWLMAAGIGLAVSTHELYYIIGFLFAWYLGLRVASEMLPIRTVRIALLGLVGLSLVIEALIISGAWSGQLTPSLNAAGVAVVLLCIAGISLVVTQLWDTTPIVVPFARAVWPTQQHAILIGGGITVGIFVLLYGNFFADPLGIIDGLYQGLAYWLGSQQSYARGDQPWYYYLMIMGINEPLALFGGFSIVIAGIVTAVRRWQLEQRGAELGAGMSLLHTFLVYWFVGALVFFSWAGEKMPWLAAHITLPANLLVVWGIVTIARNIRTPARHFLVSIPTIVVLGLMSLAVAIVQLTATTAGGLGSLQGIFPLLMGAGFIYLILHYSEVIGRANTWRLSVVALSCLLALYGIRSTWLANFVAPDTAHDPIVYTQTSPDVPRIVQDVRELSINQTRNQRALGDVAGGLSMPIMMDIGGSDGDGGLAWPFQWYFRDMKRLENRNSEFFADVTPDSFLVDAPDGGAQILVPVVMMYQPNVTAATTAALETNYVKLYDGQLNWWFPEGDKCTPSGQGYKRFYFSSLNTIKAAADCPAMDPSQLPSLLAPVLWPFDPSHWDSTWRYLMYRELPDGLEIGGRAMEVWVRADLVGGAGAGTPVSTSQTYKLVAERTFGNGEFFAARGIAVGPDGSVVVADTDSHQIIIFNSDGAVRQKIGKLGSGQGEFHEPRGVAIDANGNIFVADTWNARVVKLSPQGEWLTSWGSGDQDFGEGRVAAVTDGTEAGNAAVPLGFFGPRGIAVDGNGNVYIADTGNKRIVVTDNNGKYLYQWGSFGSAPGQFSEPIGVAVDNDGTVVVGDTWNARVQFFAADGNGRISPAPIQTWRVNGWQAQTYDDPYVAIANGQVLASIPGRNVVAVGGFDGSESLRWGGSGGDNASFIDPSGVAFGPDGKAYVIDRGNQRIMVFALP